MKPKPSIPFLTLGAGLVGLAVMLVGAIVEGAPIAGFFNIPALLIVGGGTIGATLASVGWERFAALGAAFRLAQSVKPPEWESTTVELVRAAEMARRESLLRLEDEAKRVDDPFLTLAYQMLADGIDISTIKEVLFAESETEHDRIRQYADVFTQAGGYAPTMGIIGTVMGLTHALTLLNTPSMIGPAIAAAFMATLYGVSSANLLWLPHGARLFAYGREQENYRGMIIAAVIAIHKGNNPRQVAEKLAAMSPIKLSSEQVREQVKSAAARGE